VISKKDEKWLFEKILEYYPDLKNYRSNSDLEYSFFNRLAYFLYCIEKDNPSDVRDYILKLLKIEEYDRNLDELSNILLSIKPGDKKACSELIDKLDLLLDKAEKEFPGFRKERALMISEIRSNILAIRSKGFMGSTAMTQTVRKKVKEKEKKKRTTG
jgi:hypothetical protein